MARVKGAMMTRKRRNKILKLAKGYWGAKSKHFKMANEQVMKSLQYAYVGRRLRVLVDGESGDEQWPLSSRTHGGRLVHLRGDASLIGQYVDAEILDSNTWALFGAV